PSTWASPRATSSRCCCSGRSSCGPPRRSRAAVRPRASLPLVTTTWLVGGKRTAFVRVDGPFSHLDALGLSVPVAQAMAAAATGRVALGVWGTLVPNLLYHNLAREVWLEAKLDPTCPTYSTSMACGTTMAAAFQAASLLERGGGALALVGGVESMTRVQIGLGQDLSDWLRRFVGARDLRARLDLLGKLRPGDLRLFIPEVKNRVTRKSMGERCEAMATTGGIGRAAQDAVALESHRRAVAAEDRGFFTDLIVPVGDVAADAFPRRDTSLEKLAKLKPAFDRGSGRGTLTAGNSSPLTDGAAAIWVATDDGLARLPPALPRARLVDFEMAAVDIFHEGLLMAPVYAIPRLLARHGLTFGDVTLWEIHEAFAAQLLCNLKGLEDAAFV